MQLIEFLRHCSNSLAESMIWADLLGNAMIEFGIFISAELGPDSPPSSSLLFYVWELKAIWIARF